jgi:hypothetical protein
MGSDLAFGGGGVDLLRRYYDALNLTRRQPHPVTG